MDISIGLEEPAAFHEISGALSQDGWCVIRNALSEELLSGLGQALSSRASNEFEQAGVGRGAQHLKDQTIRSDSIAWIDGATSAEERWLASMDALKQGLNQSLYLGLFSFESHFAHYAPGAFYEKHQDAFRGQSNRILTVVTYLNEQWQSDWGGELIIYSEGGEALKRVMPEPGTMVIFLSEEFPHEVLPATHDRYSIAGWFRLNSSSSGRIDPPR